MARVRATVRGRVQGVSYRWSTVDEASDRGLVGWVKNQRDGSVLLEAQGPPGELEGLLAWCRRGPAGAHVTAVEVEWLAERPGEERFEIRH